jgi:hypothetical protein
MIKRPLIADNPMKIQPAILSTILLSGCLSAACFALPQAPAAKLLRKDPVMTRHAEGTFEAKTTPVAADEVLAGTAIGRFSLVKQYHGDLEGPSKGEMIAAGELAKGNAGYVALEQVTGTLHGRTGSFALQHTGTMEGGAYKLTVTVVPGSGTGDLVGLAGTLTIVIEKGKHSYTFDYTLPPSEK